LIPQYLSATQNPDGGEPVPYSALMNEQAPGPQFQIKPGKVQANAKFTLWSFANVYIDIPY
jgi:hypothetical protein